MAKYSNKALKNKALQLIKAKSSGDFRYLTFIMTVSVRAGVSPDHVERKIHEYANS